MVRKFVDLSIPLQNAPMENNPTVIQYIPHEELGRARTKVYRFPDTSYFPDHMHCATETITSISTSGAIVALARGPATARAITVA